MNNREVTVTTKDLMSVQDTATEIGRPRIAVYRMITRGKIVPIKLGGIYYIPVSEVERLKKEQLPNNLASGILTIEGDKPTDPSSGLNLLP